MHPAQWLRAGLLSWSLRLPPSAFWKLPSLAVFLSCSSAAPDRPPRPSKIVVLGLPHRPASPGTKPGPWLPASRNFALLPLAYALWAAPWVFHWGHLTGPGSRCLLQTNPFAHSDGVLPHDLARLQTRAGLLVSLLPVAPGQQLSCHGCVGF